MPLQHTLIEIQKDLLTGVRELVSSEFGFPMKPVTDLNISVEQFLKEDNDEELESVTSSLYLAGIVTNEDLGRISEETVGESRYPGMIILAVDLTLVSPTYCHHGVDTPL